MELAPPPPPRPSFTTLLAFTDKLLWGTRLFSPKTEISLPYFQASSAAPYLVHVWKYQAMTSEEEAAVLEGRARTHI